MQAQSSFWSQRLTKVCYSKKVKMVKVVPQIPFSRASTVSKVDTRNRKVPPKQAQPQRLLKRDAKGITQSRSGASMTRVWQSRSQKPWYLTRCRSERRSWIHFLAYSHCEVLLRLSKSLQLSWRKMLRERQPQGSQTVSRTNSVINLAMEKAWQSQLIQRLWRISMESKSIQVLHQVKRITIECWESTCTSKSISIQPRARRTN